MIQNISKNILDFKKELSEKVEILTRKISNSSINTQEQTNKENRDLSMNNVITKTESMSLSEKDPIKSQLIKNLKVGITREALTDATQMYDTNRNIDNAQ